MKKLELSLVLPTYNEEESIKQVLDGIKKELEGLTYEIIVVDDSTDRTPDIVRSAGDSRVRLFHREKKSGLGSAYVMGFSKANGKFIISMDADGSHNPRYIKIFLSKISDCDVVIGSRRVEGGVRSDPLLRHVLPKFASAAYRVLLGSPVSDITSGYRVYRRSMLEGLDISDLPSDFSFQPAILMMLLKAGAKAKEVPIVFQKREAGRSKYRLKDLIGNLKFFLKMMFRGMQYG